MDIGTIVHRVHRQLNAGNLVISNAKEITREVVEAAAEAIVAYGVDKALTKYRASPWQIDCQYETHRDCEMGGVCDQYKVTCPRYQLVEALK